MKYNLTYINPKQIAYSEIKELEKKINLTFPQEIEEFLFKYSESKIEVDGFDNIINIINEDGYEIGNGIEKVLSLNEIEKYCSDIEYLYEFQEHFELSNEYVDVKYLIPIIELFGGMLYVSSREKDRGAIFWVDNGDEGILKIADNLFEVLLALEPDK
ncbi:SMI1/KNR4 family protein [Flammeovirga sp. SJP92]|uniref:SMI1/KNR4 family protein n=1 Tax=Flammeovirga sp. SJP92 TaxID=1775430 RepID=UPI0007892A89|nr:SMI1/KNR4 family protein [Flammeovirga sp. SJP92]KXX68302.1 hypothetical protein AVL50_21190 [Flammeovirga sp. SJP92]